MAKDKNVKQDVKEDVKEEKKEVKKVMTIAKTFIDLATKGAKDRESLAEGIMSRFKENGITKNVGGKEIRKERVLQQISAMLRDIKMERGKDKGSWWSKYTIVEDDKQIKIVPK